jgi:hypothetical protein
MPDVGSKSALDALAKEIKSGKHVEWPWALLRDTHFPAQSEGASVAKLDAWVRKNGIAYDFRGDEIRAGKKAYIVPVVVFRATG